MLARILAAVFLLLPLVGVSQSIDPGRVAIVHVYRKGRLSIAVSLSADGNKVVSLAPHKIVTFYLFPGNHELTLQSGEITPSALFKAEAGGEYFFQLDYEHVVSSKSLKGLSVSLSMQPKVINEDEPREVTIDQSKLIDILLKSKLGSEDMPASSPAIIPESPSPRN